MRNFPCFSSAIHKIEKDYNLKLYIPVIFILFFSLRVLSPVSVMAEYAAITLAASVPTRTVEQDL